MSKHETYTITPADVASIVTPETRARIVRYMRDSVDRHYGNIIAETARFGALSPIMRLRHAVVFSIVSPKCPIERNAAITPAIVRAVVDNHASAAELLPLFAQYGVGLQNTKSARIAANAEYLRNVTTDTVDRDTLTKLSGISLKTASMATALYDQDAEVYTLDTHMLRWLRDIANLPRETGTHNCTSRKLYTVLESFLIDIARQHCADAPIFVTQWAIWNDCGFKGVHQCHLPIFGLVAGTPHYVIDIDTTEIVAEHDTETDAMEYIAFHENAENLYVSTEY